MKPAVADGGGLPIQVILGPCDDMRAEVFVRVARPEVPCASLRLAGELAGPECRRSITLPAGATLADLGPGEAGLLAKAVLTEPAFWTPELPNLYRLTARLVADGQTMAETTRWIGLRRSGVRGRSLWLDGRRWVPRGVACKSHSCDVKAARGVGVAAVVADPQEDFLVAADEAGLAIIAVAEEDNGRPRAAEKIVERMGRWAMHPAVVITLLPQAVAESDVAALAALARRLKGTMLLVRAVDGASPPPGSVAAGIDGLCVALDRGALPHDAWREAAPAVPLIAWQRGDAGHEPTRAACDRLQASLASWGLAAGGTHQPWVRTYEQTFAPWRLRGKFLVFPWAKGGLGGGSTIRAAHINSGDQNQPPKNPRRGRVACAARFARSARGALDCAPPCAHVAAGEPPC